MQQPIFSVVIDTYNHEKFIEQAIRSVLDQDFSATELEVIVVDDGSCDATAQIASQFEPRIRLIRKQNGGQASAFNAGIAAAHADFVAFLDADDWWAPGKLRAVLAAFNANPTIAAVGHGYYEVREGEQTIVLPGQTSIVNLSSAEAGRRAELARVFLGTSRLAVRRQVLSHIGELPIELLFCADTPILTLVLALGGALIIDQSLCYYRLHSSNLFAGGGRDLVRARRQLEIRKFLHTFLPRRLSELGVPQDVIAAHMESDEIQLERLQLQMEGGSRWRTIATESRAFSNSFSGSSAGYSVFKGLVRLLAILLPPERFYDLRGWYAEQKDLHRVMRIVGKPTPKACDFHDQLSL